MSEELLKGIASAFKIQADEWIATLKDGDDWLSEKEIATKVSQLISEKVTAAKKESRGSGQAEQNAKFSKIIKSEGFENPDGLQGDALLSAFLAWKDEQIVPNLDAPVDQLDREALLKLPLVKEIIIQTKQDSGKGNEKLKAEFEAYKLSVERERAKYNEERALDISKRHLGDALRKGNVILKVDGLDVSEQDRIDLIFDTIRLREKIGLNANGEPIFLGEDGEQKRDEFGNVVNYNDVVIKYGKSAFGISAQDPSHSGANPPQGQSSTGKTDYVPKYRFGTVQEFDNKLMTTTDNAERLELSRSKQFLLEQKAAGT